MDHNLAGAALGSSLGAALGGTVLGEAAQGILSAVVASVAGAAVWLLGQVGHVMSATSSVNLDGSWFTSHFKVMAVLAAAVALPMACCGVILAVYRQDASTLVRGILVKLPLALVFTGMSVELVSLAMAVTDNLSDGVLSAGGVDTTHLLEPLALVVGASAGGGPVPAFLVLVGALLVVLAALVLWMELVVRSAAIAVAVLFLPLSLTGMVWPATAHWCRRLADTVAALVLSKLVVAAVLSLAAGALAGGSLSAAAGDVTGGFATVVTGIALLFVATASPFVLLRLVPAIEAGAVMHLESARHRLQHTATAPVRSGANLAITTAGIAGMLGGGMAAAQALGGASGTATAGATPVAGGSLPGRATLDDLAQFSADRGPEADQRQSPPNGVRGHGAVPGDDGEERGGADGGRD